MDVPSSSVPSHKRTLSPSKISPALKKQILDNRECIDLSAEDPCEDPGPSLLTAGDVSPSTLDSPPLHLFAVRAGIPPWANEGFLGASLPNLVSGPIQLALISNYMVDFTWLLSACPALNAVPSVVLVHGESGASAMAIHRAILAAGMAGRAVTHTPPLPPYGTHHSKAFLLQYSTGLRVIVHTANLLYCDTNNKTQGLFYQDFPLKDTLSPESSPFENDLLEYLLALGLAPALSRKVADIVKKHDFSAARVHLIASVPSGQAEFSGLKMNSFGHLKLRACLQKEPGGFPSQFSRSPVLAQYSSIGNLSTTWLSNFCDSLSAGTVTPTEKKPQTVFKEGTTGSTKIIHQPPATSAGVQQQAVGALGPPPGGLPGLHLVWPTTEEVRNSVEGWFAGGSIPGYPDKVKKDFLQGHYRRWGGEVVGRQRAMPHIKSYCRFDPKTKELAWMCITSHNLSKAAWGEQQESKRFNRTLLKILSFELGVLLVPSLELAYRKSRWYGFSCTDTSQSRQVGPMPGAIEASRVRLVQWQRGEVQHATISEDGCITVPIPVSYLLPPKEYESEDVPWDVRAGMPGWKGVDALGAPYPGVGAHYGVLDHMEWGDVIAERLMVLSNQL